MFLHILVALVYARLLKKTLSQSKLRFENNVISKMTGTKYFGDVNSPFCLPAACLPCLTFDVNMTLSFVSRYILSDVNGFDFQFLSILYIM